MARNCWAKGGGSHGDEDGDDETNNSSADFPGVHNKAL